MRRWVLCWLLAPGSMALAASVDIRTSELPRAIVRSAYSATVETGVDGRCPSGNVKLSLSQGQLPDGLELRGSTIAGTPRTLGAFHFALRASNECGATTRALELVVTGKPILTATPLEIAFEWRTGEAVPDARKLRLVSTWPDLPYAIRADAPWLSVSQPGGATPPEGSAMAAEMIAVRPVVKDLAPGVYQSRVTISSWVGQAMVVIPVKLTVKPAATASAAK